MLGSARHRVNADRLRNSGPAIWVKTKFRQTGSSVFSPFTSSGMNQSSPRRIVESMSHTQRPGLMSQSLEKYRSDINAQFPYSCVDAALRYGRARGNAPKLA